MIDASALVGQVSADLREGQWLGEGKDPDMAAFTMASSAIAELARQGVLPAVAGEAALRALNEWLEAKAAAQRAAELRGLGIEPPAP